MSIRQLSGAFANGWTWEVAEQKGGTAPHAANGFTMIVRDGAGGEVAKYEYLDGDSRSFPPEFERKIDDVLVEARDIARKIVNDRL